MKLAPSIVQRAGLTVSASSQTEMKTMKIGARNASEYASANGMVTNA